MVPNRHGSTADYRYGFQGQEKDDEIKGEGNFIAYADRGYDPRIGRFISIDAYANAMPSQSPYSFALNNPIYFVDENGNWPKPSELLPKDTSPFIKGLVDGIWEGITGTAGFAIDYFTNSKFRESVNQSFTKLISDPMGTLGGIVDEYAGKIKRLATGKATDDDVYDLGGEVGEGLVGAFVGGATLGVKAAKKMLKPDISKSKLAKEAKKSAEDVAEGGAHGRLKNIKGDDGKNITEKNHLPSQQSYKLADFEITSYLGSANIMDKVDHRNFITTGSSKAANAFRSAEAKLLKAGRFLDAFDLNAGAIKKQFGNKYDKSLKEAREHYIKEVIPELQAQYKKANP